MQRFFILFGILLVVCLALMAAMMAQYGYSLFAPEMRMMLLVSFLVAGYVAFRITQVISKRERRRERGEAPGGAGQSKLSGLFNRKSPTQLRREARIAARREELVKKGKLAAEPVTEEPADKRPPTRVSQNAPLKDRMAAREERVRRARAEGKLKD